MEEAEAGVKQAGGGADRARRSRWTSAACEGADARCTVERITIGPRATLGVSTRARRLPWLIPAGPRVVRAGSGSGLRPPRRPRPHRPRGHDLRPPASDAQRTRGLFAASADSFLLKRAKRGELPLGDTRVIEVVVEVSTRHPRTGPRSRVGQAASRVNLGQ